MFRRVALITNLILQRIVRCQAKRKNIFDKTQEVKGATKLYFTRNSCVVIILFNTHLYKFSFCTNSFRKLIFWLSELFVLCQIRCNLHEVYSMYMIIVSEATTRGVLCKKAVLRNFLKFTGKHLCQNLFFNKVACLRPGLQLYQKRDSDTGVIL